MNVLGPGWQGLFCLAQPPEEYLLLSLLTKVMETVFKPKLDHVNPLFKILQ